MDIFKSLLIGMIQGLTEFLPVSSSGHIVIAEHILSLESPGLLYEVILHFGTLLSVLVVFRKEIYSICSSLFNGIYAVFKKKSLPSGKENPDFNLGIYIILGSIPSGIVGFFFRDVISVLFESPLFVSFSLIFTGIILFFTRYARERKKELSLLSAIIIGCAQIIAIIPGVSRSGITISAGIFLGISRERAVKFSFFLSMPVIFGATLLEMIDSFVFNNPEINLFSLFIGFISAFVFGYFAIRILLKTVISGKFYIFSYYCLIVGILGLIYL